MEPIDRGLSAWLPSLLDGLEITLAVAVCGFVCALLIGGVTSWMKLSGPAPARAVASVYTSVTRSVPNLIIVFLFYYGSSELLTRISQLGGSEGFVGVPTFVAGFLALGVASGALCAEIFRGASRAVEKGQVTAALAYGMSRPLLFRRVLAPHILKHSLPALGNVWQGLLKESTLLSVIGLNELVTQAQFAANTTVRPFFFFLIAIVFFLIITAVSSLLWTLAESRLSRDVVRSSK